MVLTEFGNKPIEKIEVGDYVWSKDPLTGENALKRVVHTFENNVSELVCIQTKEETITCTAEHMFYVCGRGWIAAKDIKPFDKFTLYNKQTTVVESVEYKDVENGIKVYNLEVEEYHTYFVGKQCIFVHNKCWRAERRGYWKKQASIGGNSTWYEVTDDNLRLMKAGKAPIGYDGLKVVLHHVRGKAVDMSDYVEMSATAHIAFHKMHGYKGF